MKPLKPRPPAVLAAVLCVAISGVLGAPASATELAATHLVFDKAVKMKKVDTFLFLPLLDQSTGADTADSARLIGCRVFAEGKNGPLPTRGTFRLRLQGEINASEPWDSARVTRPIDADGKATFQPEDILGLVDEARADEADPDLLQIQFDGGKGKKVLKLTIDCENRKANS